MKLIEYDVQSGETKVLDVPDENVNLPIIHTLTPEERFAEMEAEIVRLKSELNVQ